MRRKKVKIDVRKICIYKKLSLSLHRGLENKIMKKKNIKHLRCICRYCGGIAIPIGNAYNVETENRELKSITRVVKFGCKSCGHIIEKYYL